MEYALALVLLGALVALFVLWPLRRGRNEAVAGAGGDASTVAADGRRTELEAAKEAKLREIRDAELDREMGKLSEEDWRLVDGELRAQAIAILRELDELGDDEPAAGPG